MKYRSRTDIVATILQSVKDSGGAASKTRIMYKGFLSYAQLKDYLSVLVENDLLTFNEGDQLYHITSKGTKFIDAANSTNKLLASPSNLR